MKSPLTKRLKLKCDESLPNFAFNFNLRHYLTCDQNDTYAMFETVLSLQPRVNSGGGMSRDDTIEMSAKVRWCSLTVSKPALKAPMFSEIEAYIDEPLSRFAFEFNLRGYNKDIFERCPPPFDIDVVRRCRLNLSRTLRLPGAKRLKLKYDEPLSKIAFTSTCAATTWCTTSTPRTTTSP
jgi:hypothetical protein